jgi:hypothetical protein
MVQAGPCTQYRGPPPSQSAFLNFEYSVSEICIYYRFLRAEFSTGNAAISIENSAVPQPAQIRHF